MFGVVELNLVMFSIFLFLGSVSVKLLEVIAYIISLALILECILYCLRVLFGCIGLVYVL